MLPWSLQNSKNWKKNLTCWKKLAKKKNIFCTGPPPPPELHIRIVKQNPNFMYPGTWNFVVSSNPCTRVHDVMFFLQIYVPGMEFWFFFKSMYPSTWNLDFVSLLMCSSGGGGGPVQKIFFLFAKCFQHVKKLFNFWNFVKIKMAKFKLNHLG